MLLGCNRSHSEGNTATLSDMKLSEAPIFSVPVMDFCGNLILLQGDRECAEGYLQRAREMKDGVCVNPEALHPDVREVTILNRKPSDMPGIETFKVKDLITGEIGTFKAQLEHCPALD